jgi:hypothetical protein
MTNCSTLYKSKKVQAHLEKSFKENASEFIKENGGLPAFSWRDFKKGYKKGFMETCKMRKKKMTLNKKRNNNKTKKLIKK